MGGIPSFKYGASGPIRVYLRETYFKALAAETEKGDLRTVGRNREGRREVIGDFARCSPEDGDREELHVVRFFRAATREVDKVCIGRKIRPAQKGLRGWRHNLLRAGRGRLADPQALLSAIAQDIGNVAAIRRQRSRCDVAACC